MKENALQSHAGLDVFPIFLCLFQCMFGSGQKVTKGSGGC